MRQYLIVILLLWSVGVRGQIITTFAGTGSTVFSGEGVPATSAGVPSPSGIVFDRQGNCYIGDILSSYRIRKITPSGIISTIAGTGMGGYIGDGGPATAARLQAPVGMDLDTAGNLYFADAGNNRIRKINMATGIITTIAGTGAGSYGGDGGPATLADLYNPQDVRADTMGNIYIGAFYDNRIRKIDATGIITTIAGGGSTVGLGDDGPATAAHLVAPWGVEIDDTGNVYLAQTAGSTLSNRIRKINTTGIITTLAGTGAWAYTGDGIPATAATIGARFIALDTSGQLYISDHSNNRIYKIDHSGILHLVAGNGSSVSAGDGGAATAASIWDPGPIAFDPCGNLYISDVSGRRIRKVTLNPASISTVTITVTPNDTVCAGTPVTCTATTTGGSTMSFAWYKNGVVVPGATSDSYSYTTSGTGDSVRCVYTGVDICSFTGYPSSNTINMVINPTTTASVAITATPNDTVCNGTAVTCTATITGGGATPAYQWYVNGSPVTGTTAYTFTPATGDSVSCVMASSAACPVPDDTAEGHMLLTVLPYVTPSVSITSTLTSDATCEGDTVLFTATAINGGPTPGYQWKKNGVNVGTGGSTYIYAPANGDTVRCVLTSSETCPTATSVSSSMIGPILVAPLILPAITISASPAAIGETVTVNATITGTASYNIKWYKNTILFATTTTPVATYTKAAGADVITARVVHAGAGCYDSVTSAAITVASANQVALLQEEDEFSIYPNPAHDAITVSGTGSIYSVVVTNLLGQSYDMLPTTIMDKTAVVDIALVPAGVYVVRVNGVYFRRFVKE